MLVEICSLTENQLHEDTKQVQTLYKLTNYSHSIHIAKYADKHPHLLQDWWTLIWSNNIEWNYSTVFSWMYCTISVSHSMKINIWCCISYIGC